jgi:hypothetical protein
MRREFWQFVHDQLEHARHWVYYHKLAPPSPEVNPGYVNYKYHISYVCGRTGMITDLPPIPITDETIDKPANTENVPNHP